MSGETIVVGAIQELDDSEGFAGPFEGAAYVFVRSGTNWIQQALLTASNAEKADRFGRSVAIAGDTIAVGATDEASNATGVNGNQNDNSAPNSGAVYVFVRNGTNWNQQAYLKASAAGKFFGWSVAVSGETVSCPALAEVAAYVFSGLGPPTPQLSIERFPGGVRVFWPLPGTGFVLEDVNALGGSLATGWSVVPLSAYQTNATHISFTLAQPASQMFYRLRKL
jgi:hypothetical protein